MEVRHGPVEEIGAAMEVRHGPVEDIGAAMEVRHGPVEEIGAAMEGSVTGRWRRSAPPWRTSEPHPNRVMAGFEQGGGEAGRKEKKF